MDKLNGLLINFAKIFPKIGYAQGMNFIAGFVLMNLRCPFRSINVMIFLFKKMEFEKVFLDIDSFFKLFNFQIKVFFKKYLLELYSHLVVHKFYISVMVCRKVKVLKLNNLSSNTL